MRAMTSAKFRPAAWTSTRTWPGPGAGSGRCSTRSTEGSPWLVMTTARTARRILIARGHGHRWRRRRRALEEPGRRRLRPAPEEVAVLEPRDDHQHDSEQQRADADGDRHLDAGDRLGVVEPGLRVVVERLIEDVGHDHDAGERHEARVDEVARAVQQLAAVVDRAGDPGQAVVEADAEPEGADRV